MSSAEEDYNGTDSAALPDSKKRRVQRACDACRRKKSRCDGNQVSGSQCSNCITYSSECTYIQASKRRRGHPKGYVENLENRLEKMEKLLQKVGGEQVDVDGWQRPSAGASTPGQSAMNATPPAYGNANASTEDPVTSDDEGIVTLRLTENFKSINLFDRSNRFFGKSSGVMLLQKAIDLKNEVTGSQFQPHYFFHQIDKPCYPWELTPKDMVEPEYSFPDEDLGMQLVQLYFVHLNSVMPILHRPTFERNIMQGVHLRNSSLAALYLLVCAVASRFSDDPRVFLDGIESTISEHSAGWKFFKQVQVTKRSLFGPPCLEDIQTYCLSVLYLFGTSSTHTSWTIIGIGIRLALDVGAHRRKSYDGKPSVEGELWKRVFWALVILDRQLSTSLGRPIAIQDEDFDLDLPIECDDEYWEHPDPEQAFKQPPDKPSAVAYFNNLIKLCNILSFAHRTIYSINKSKVLLGFIGPQWEQQIVAELDSSLNRWIDGVPDYLRWDPARDANSIFFLQSTLLYTNYYHVQIFIHRPFIPSPRKPSPLSFPSLAICANAARSCSHVVDIYRKRASWPTPLLLGPAFAAGIVLLVNIWGGKRSGLSTDPAKEMADVHKCMDVLKDCEKRWHVAGSLWYILYELAFAGDLPVPQPNHLGGTKRERDDDSSPILSSPSVPKTKDSSTRATAGTRRVLRDAHSQAHKSASQSPQAHDLPVYSNDLGRLPVHGQVNFAKITATPSVSLLPSDDVWFSTMTRGALSQQQEPMRPTTVDNPITVADHDFAPQVGAYSIDDLFLNQISSGAFGGLAANPTLTLTHAAAVDRHAVDPNTSGPGSSSRSHVESAATTEDLQAFLDATATATVGGGVVQPHPQSSTLPPTRQGVAFEEDQDTIEMWLSAPTGFGVSDWGTYLSNVSGGMSTG